MRGCRRRHPGSTDKIAINAEITPILPTAISHLSPDGVAGLRIHSTGESPRNADVLRHVSTRADESIWDRDRLDEEMDQ